MNIHDYLAEFEDIPGTRVYTATRARQGYWLNQFAMSLMKSDNRKRWLADPAQYLAEWPMSEAQKQAVLARDYNRLLDLGVSHISSSQHPFTNSYRNRLSIEKTQLFAA